MKNKGAVGHWRSSLIIFPMNICNEYESRLPKANSHAVRWSREPRLSSWLRMMENSGTFRAFSISNLVQKLFASHIAHTPERPDRLPYMCYLNKCRHSWRAHKSPPKKYTMKRQIHDSVRWKVQICKAGGVWLQFSMFPDQKRGLDESIWRLKQVHASEDNHIFDDVSSARDFMTFHLPIFWPRLNLLYIPSQERWQVTRSSNMKYVHRAQTIGFVYWGLIDWIDYMG